MGLFRSKNGKVLMEGEWMNDKKIEFVMSIAQEDTVVQKA